MMPAATALQYLALDLGEQRTGVAVGNTLLRAAQPLKTIFAAGDARFTPIAGLIKEWQPHALVLGIPRHPDGAPHQMTQRALKFARQLHGRFGLVVHEVDERYSSAQALSDGARDLDAGAACILLEQFFNTESFNIQGKEMP